MPSKKASVPSRKRPVAKKISQAPRKPSRPSRKKSSRVSLWSQCSAWLDSISPTSILVIGICVVAFSIVTTFFVDLSEWYWSLPRPEVMATGWLFQFGLTGVFALLTVSLVILWNARKPGTTFLIWLFVLMGMLHLMWNMFFFGLHMVAVSFVIGLALLLLVLGVMALVLRRSQVAAFLLVPYFSWVLFLLFFTTWILVYSL